MGLTTRKYDILTRVAVGNSALVYRAVDKATMRQVALKLLVRDEELDHRFNVEALLADSPKLTQIAGAHVCQLLDAYTDEDGPVLIYEFANGVSGMELPGKRKLEAAHALDVAAQLISALRSGERQRRPHGDLKPSNIVFVDLPDGRLFTLVLDWGLTAYRTTLPEDSLPFHAPERLAGAAASHPADLFSVGAILFHLYTGKVLATGATRAELLAAWQRARPAMLAEMRPDLPPKLVQWVCSLLELTPEKRPASAVEAATALAALNPPPPPVPPEAVRPRSPQQRPSGPPSSGIAKPPSASRTAPLPTVSPSTARTTSPPATPSRRPARFSHVAMTVGLFMSLVALLSGSVWFVFFRAKEPAYPREPVAADPGQPIAARTPSPSIGSDVGRKYAPPPVSASTAKTRPPRVPAARATAGATATAAPGPVQAASKPGGPLLASEAFEYPGGTEVVAMKGGAGWNGPWKGPLARAEGGSLESNQFPARGGSLVIPPSQREISLSRAINPLREFVDPKKGGTWYFACLLQHGSGSPAPGDGDIQINPFSGSDVRNLVRITAGNVGGALQLTLNDAKNSIAVSDPSQPVFVVLQVTLGKPGKNGKSELRAALYLNPVIDANWPRADERNVEIRLPHASLPKQFGLLIRKPAGSGATTRIDEIRFAHQATDLSHRPPPAAKQPTATARK